MRKGSSKVEIFMLLVKATEADPFLSGAIFHKKPAIQFLLQIMTSFYMKRNTRHK